MLLWLAKPVYEFLPWFYGGAGLLLLVAAFGFRQGWWLAACLVLGLALVTAGGFVGWRRREYRRRH
jgi:hypothetical protein